MKRLCFSVIALFTASVVLSAELRVTSPNGGENWLLGSAQTIKWQAQGIQGNVRLILLKERERLGTIADNIPASAGSFPWTVGLFERGETQEQAATGSGYRILVKSLQATAEDASDRPFTISGPDLAGPATVKKTITVTAPNGGETWKSGEKRKISWLADGVRETYRVALLKGGMEVGLIADNVPSTQNTLSWNIGDPLMGGRTYVQGNDYRVQVRAKSGSPKDESNGPFTLSFLQPALPAATVQGKPLPLSIKVTIPNGGESYFSGRRQFLGFDIEGSINFSSITFNLIRITPKSGSWPISRDFSGTYEIPDVIDAVHGIGTFIMEAKAKMIGSETWVQDESDRPFTIKRGQDLELSLRDLKFYVQRQGSEAWYNLPALVRSGDGAVEIGLPNDAIWYKVKATIAIKNTGLGWNAPLPMHVVWTIMITDAATNAEVRYQVGSVDLQTNSPVEDSLEMQVQHTFRGTFRLQLKADPGHYCHESEIFWGNNNLVKTLIVR